MFRIVFIKSNVICFILTCWFYSYTSAQEPKRYNAAEIQLALNKLTVLGSALYIAAHPDDENTRLIAWLSNEKLVNTAYFSVTRGDGGQNLIGTETGVALGLIRTQELLEARKIDGGKQFFSRAIDFGFSKHPDETFNIWDKDAVLKDLVWAIRKFRPDVLITRFNKKPGTTHGHHTASAILAEQAFAYAGDKQKFPQQLQFVDVWAPSSLYWNTSSWFYEENKFDTTGLLMVDVGKYNATLGKAYSELAAESRSMHKSQGFGSSGTRGTTFEYLEPLKGKAQNKDLFHGLNTSWSRIKGGEKVGAVLKKAAKNFNANNPAATVPDLLEANKLLKALPESHWKAVKLVEIQQAIEACLGFFTEALANDYSIARGDSLTISMELVNRSKFPVKVQKISYSVSAGDSILNTELKENKLLQFNKKIKLEDDLPYSQPYWLREEGTVGMFKVDQVEMIGKPENDPAIKVFLDLLIGDQTFVLERPIVYKRTDPVAGEQYRNLEIVPQVFVNVKEQVLMFASDNSKLLEVTVRAGSPNIQGNVKLDLPEGWSSDPESFPVKLSKKGEDITLMFEVVPPSSTSSSKIGAYFIADGKKFDRGYHSITYTHIPNQLILPEATVTVARLDIKKKGENIAYIMGAGDEVPKSLRQIGYKVSLLEDGDINLNILKKFDAVILGIRAYNTVDKLKFYQTTLLEYVKQGGNMIVQYSTNGGMVTQDIAPFAMKISRDRVAVEDAPVRIIQPNHPVMNIPNKITDKDFEGWVQERGLYFATEWDPSFQPILSMNDPDEEPKEGSMLVAPYGKGYYTYTGLSFFRQLTAGVPGAYRIFANIISLGQEDLNK
ncbi:MAG: PIG-L family deacetylase [Bacteroidota bacterium]|nr:PIG-L family deacetylase [Bacteroidota bacterium]